ncbi:DJ-1/PfpI family protein [Actinobaculum sp. 352]|nr:dimethyladenosine transferase [Actinobaculum sp. 313]RTE48316.1 DJ-1/PfpI family protein [Actinobaculum sp. 352]
MNIVLYEGFTALDVFGPVEVLGDVEDFRLRYVSLAGGIVTNRQLIRLETEALDTVARGQIVLVPGGLGSRKIIKDARFIAALRQLVDEADYVLCVCTGSALVAETGVLNGRKATTNTRAFHWVADGHPAVEWVRGVRWVADGKYYTSAGVSAGIDMALGFVGDRYGLAAARDIAERMEYRWVE